jgi:hypothetical protein
MKVMGWTYQEYLRTPAHIVSETSMFMRTESKLIEDAMGSGGDQ